MAFGGEAEDGRGCAAAGPPPAVLGAAIRLNRAETGLIRACRRYAEGPDGWAMMPQQLWLLCGIARIEAVLHGLEAVMKLALARARRPLDLRVPETAALSADELALVTLVAAAQTGDRARAEAIARWLVLGPAQAALVRRAERLGAVLADCGLEVRAVRPCGPSDFRLDGGA